MTKKKEELSLSVDNAEQIDYIKKLTGEFGVPAGMQWVSFNGNTGKFYQGTGDNKIEIGDAVSGTIVRVAVRVETQFESRVPVKVRSNELLNTQGEIELYSLDNNELVDTLEYAEAKDKYDLKFSQILYIALDEMGGEVVKLQVSSSRSLKALWGYLGSFGKDTVIRWKTSMGAAEFKAEKGGKFFHITFTRGEELDAETTQLMLTHLSAINVEPVKKASKMINDGDTITIVE